MSEINKILSDHVIESVFLTGDVTMVDEKTPLGKRCLPFTVISCIFPHPEERWNGCGCIFPEGEYFSKKPACWIVPPYCRHEFIRYDRLHISTWGHFEFTIGNGIDLLHFYNVPRFVTGKKAENLQDLLLESYCSKEKDPVSRCRGKGAQYRILSEILGSSTPLARGIEEVFDPFFTGICQYIKENLQRRISLDELASFAGLSRSSLEKKFRHAAGVSPGEFILRFRLREGAWMLRSSSMTHKEIAEAVGFADVYTFSKAFQRKFNRPPGKFRKEKIYG